MNKCFDGEFATRTHRSFGHLLALTTVSAFLLSLLLSGCTAFQVGREIQSGRFALMFGEPKVALGHFQRAAELNPDYLLNFSRLDEGVWTYIGRSYYAMGNFSDARKALERARSRYDQDNIAKLYLGLVLARDGDRERGRREIQAGLKDLRDWLNYMDQYLEEGRYWDPGRRLRKEIQRNLEIIEGRDIDWTQLIASGEWLGSEFEREIEFAQRDKYRHQRNGGGGGNS